MFFLNVVTISRGSIFVVLAILMILGSCSTSTVLPDLDEQKIREKLAISRAFITSNQNDSVLYYLQPVLEQLENRDAQHTALGMEVRLLISKAQAQHKQDVDALLSLKELVEQSKIQKQWEIYVESCLTLARLYHKIYRSGAAKQLLEEAGATINDYQLDTFLPEFAILTALWQSEFGVPDSVAYYAELAMNSLDTAENNSAIIQIEYHTLQGRLISRANLNQCVAHLKKAATLSRLSGDYERLIYLFHQISKEYCTFNKTEQCLAYNDSAIVAAYQAIAAGKLYGSNVLADVNMQRGAIFKSMGQLDSALLYSQKGGVERTRYLLQQENFRIREVDAKYNNQKQTLQLAEQQEEIKTGRSIRLLLFGIIFLALLVLVLIIYGFRRQKQVNQKLEKQAEQLTLLDKMKSHFFANVSHELRTPLTLMLGPINSLLKGRQLTPKQAQLLEIAENNGRQLQLLINEILDLRKLEAGKLEVDTQPILLYSFLYQCCTQFKSFAESKEIRLSIDIKIEKQLVGQLDAEKCRQIFYNLLSNAFKYTPSGGKVTCKIVFQKGLLRASITDTGQGIHPDDLPHIFDQYFQTNRPEKMLEGGTGIGLAICKEYVQLFGGDITADSTLGKGTSIRLGFPVSLVEDMSVSAVQPMERSQLANLADLPEKPTAKTKRAAQKKASILVVEDNTDLANYLKIILSEKYEVTTAKNGKIAWDLLLADSDSKPINTYQLILSDLMMPVMNGYQLLGKLKSHDATRHIPVVMLTARAELRDKLQALRIGVDDYLIKPFEEEELVVRIENLLKHRTNEVTTEPEDEKMIPLISQEDQQWLADFENFVQENMSNDLLSVPMLADQFSMSEPTLFRQLKRLTGLSPVQYIQEVRLEKALRLLEHRTYKSISKVAYQIGYTDPNSFSRAFKRRYGKSPSSVLNI